MGMYESFARVYDTFMDDVPYEEWGRCLTRLLKEQGIGDGLVLDLGCGTGAMTRLLAGSGYDMIGVDSSPDMLQIASEKGRDGILYLQQDMREFELYGTVRAVVSVCDSLNYVTDEEDLFTVFRLVCNYLDPGGWFFFDMNTLWKYRNLLGDAVFAENREDCSYIWENSWFEDEKINEYDLTLFVRGGDGRYERFSETHYQKGYEISRIKEILGRAGLECMGIWDGYSTDKAGPRSERVLFAARETLKEKTGRN